MLKIRMNKTNMLPFIFCFFTLHTANASEDVEIAGDVLQILIPAIAFGSTVYRNDLDGQKEFYKSFATTVAITHSLKNVIDKKRPSGSNQSFPSGHTSAAFQGAAFIHKKYGFRNSLPAYAGAAFVGYSRVVTDHHFAEDVVVGAIIGTLSSLYFTTNISGLNYTPTATTNYFGVELSIQW